MGDCISNFNDGDTGARGQYAAVCHVHNVLRGQYTAVGCGHNAVRSQNVAVSRGHNALRSQNVVRSHNVAQHPLPPQPVCPDDVRGRLISPTPSSVTPCRRLCVQHAEANSRE